MFKPYLIKLIFYFVSFVYIVSCSDKTIYSDGYDEQQFESIKEDMPTSMVLKLIGNPLKIEETPSYEKWEYGTASFSINHTQSDFINDHYKTSINVYPIVCFDIGGKVIFYNNSAYKSGINSSFTKDKVQKLLGTPKSISMFDELKIFYYSVQGKREDYEVRIIHLRDDKVIKIIKGRYVEN